MNPKLLGPGPVIHGPDMNRPGSYIIQRVGHDPEVMTAAQIAALPIPPQWFTTTVLGQLASWPTRDIAESRVDQVGVMLGRIEPRELNGSEHMVPVLCDPHGRPLRCEA
jgi:hypothetical protein